MEAFIPQGHCNIVSEVLRGNEDTHVNPFKPFLCCNFLPVCLTEIYRNGQLGKGVLEKNLTKILEYPIFETHLQVSLGFLEITQDLHGTSADR